jgi:hypothetical protein
MELLERFVAGDLDAFEVLFRQHQKQVYTRIVRTIGPGFPLHSGANFALESRQFIYQGR